ncbi:PAS domain S-box protein [Mucilaginibacter pallidiroseus]|uniref:PAS domain S-box protein n=1 Tax=Mucilaginibacter pallidiroseus TaxID=2599295 RepID=A0A563UJT2_9SPHI|nr:chemotaxis protein CheB [Mucilaginibacter pallidiroseus]TWR31546.1 PAS domain S-box protein [Mucilaginibacter pallidiroseus]
MAKSKQLTFPESKPLDRYIIAIGASAGGLEAIHDFFDHMPGNSGFTFVVIQHLSPDYKSLLVELVSKHTHMKVFEATNDMTLQRDCVYIIPNKKLMTIKGHKLRLADKLKDKLPNTAIDTFLFTLAKDKKEKAIAIILSGTGTDGTKGVEAIKEFGGMVIVQDPSSAKFDGMPNSAITSGNADFVLPPSKMHVEIYNYVNQSRVPSLDRQDFDDQLLDELFELVHRSSGQDFNLYKTPTILRRIARRMATNEIKTLNDYIELLRKDAAEVKLLAKDFLIGVTKFFRDKPAFDILAKDIIPTIVKFKQEGEILKVWVCACSTGEEAYTIAVLINDHLAKIGKHLEVKIFATDVDESSIEIAAKNSYPLSVAKEIPADILKKYFIKEGNRYSVIPSVRKQIVFARHNVIKSPPFIKNDLVTCRNMLIYMNTLLQEKVIATFHYSLNKHGFLFLGSSENAASIREGVTEISSKWKIYQKSGTVSYGLHHTYTAATTNLKYTDNRIPVKPIDTTKSIEEEFKSLVMEEFGPVGIFIDRGYIIKETIGDFRRFLELPEKKLELNVLSMVSRDVSIALNAAIRRAWKEHQKVHLNKVRIKKGDNDLQLQITVKPPDSRSPNGYTLLMFAEVKVDVFAKEGIVLPPVDGAPQQEYLMEMEAELSETRINLQMAVEEMETTNEELQSSNEELLSANEELQSGNEELQSLNEELHTLNTEHQLKIRELVELNDDLDNYFKSTDIGQVFIDANLHIRKFNPAAIKMINLIEADIGRPINHISSNLVYDDLINDIHTVLAKDKVVEKEIQLKNGTNNLMRIMPYVKKDKQRDGVVISFVDVTKITELNNMISGVFNASTAAILAFRKSKTHDYKAADFKCLAYNHAAAAVFHKTNDEMEAHPSIREFPQLIKTVSIDKLIKVVESGKPLQTEIQDGDNLWYHVIIAKMNDGFIVSLTDVSERHAAEQKLRKNYHELITAREGLRNLNHQLEDKIYERTRKLSESEERFKLVSQATNDTIWDWNLVNNTMWRSENFTTMFGYPRNEETNRIGFWIDKIHPDDRKRVEDSVYHAINHHIMQWSAEYRFEKADGSFAVILDRGSVLEDEFKTPYRLVGSVVDITRLIETEKRLTDSESKFKKVFESNMIGMLFARLDGEILEANSAFLNMLGYEENDPAVMGMNWLNITPPEYHEISFWAVDQLEQNGICPPFEKQYIKKDGSYIWVLMGSALLEQDGEKTSVSYIIDISKQKEAEKRRTELQDLIVKQQDELMQKKDEFMSIASHELKTPVTSIKGSLQILERMARKRKENDPMVAFIDKANKQTGKLTILLNDLLDVTKIQEGKMLLNYTTFDAHAMVRECIDEVMAQENSHELVLGVDCETMVSADRVRLEQVVINFLTNAIKYSPEANKVKITCNIVDKELKITVQDFGIGIPDSKKGFLFDRFFRVQESSTHFSGLGLGLYISAEIIKRHNGKIGVDSRVGQGSTFWFTIPL